MTLKELTIALLLSIAVNGVGTIAANADTPAQKGCMNLRSWQREQNIKGGMDRRKADAIWTAAVKKCKQSKQARYMPPGRNGAPERTQGGGTRRDLIALSVPRDREGGHKPKIVKG